LIRRESLDPAHKYPVILFVYGMPSIPTIHNAWQPALLNNQLLLEDGYVVVGLDSRASTGISKKLENISATNPESTTADLVAGVRC
jgi:dipeptidyl-peptidase-4